MGYTISDAVSEVLGEMQFLRVAFQHDVVNYSALARLIKPLVEEKLGAAAGVDAIIMGIRRYATTATREKEPQDIMLQIKDCTLTVRTDMAAVYFRHWRTKQFVNKLTALQMEDVDWNAGEKIYTIDRSGEILLLANAKFLVKLLEIGSASPGTKLLDKRTGLAVLTVSYPPEALDTPGVFAFMAQRLASAGVNMLSVFTTYRKISFLIDERDVGKAYDHLSKAISSSRRLYEVLHPEQAKPAERASAKAVQ